MHLNHNFLNVVVRVWTSNKEQTKPHTANEVVVNQLRMTKLLHPHRMRDPSIYARMNESFTIILQLRIFIFMSQQGAKSLIGS